MPKTNRSELPFLIMNAARTMAHELHAKGGRTALSMLHFKILAFIGCKERATMKEIASFLGITPPSATVLAGRLVKAGQARRVGDDRDRRAVMIALTPSGRRSVERDKREIMRRLGRMLGRLSEDEKSQLAAILNRLSGN